MTPPIKPVNNPERLHTLNKTRLMDSPSEQAFERLTEMARRLLRTPVALVSLVDDHRQFFKSSSGLPEPWQSSRGTPLTHSFCQHVVNDGGPLVIDDASKSARVKDNLAVSELGVAAYAGMPITSSCGHTLGSFCVIDVEPRHWTEEELAVLKELTQACITEVALREKCAEQEEYLRRFENWMARMPVGAFICSAAMQISSWNPVAQRIFGYTAAEAAGRTPQELLFKLKDRADAEQRFLDMAITGEASRAATQCVDKEGKGVVCTWTTTALLDPDGSFGGFIAMFEEVASGVAHTLHDLLTTIHNSAMLLVKAQATHAAANGESAVAPKHLQLMAELAAQVAQCAEKAAALAPQLAD